MKLLFILLSIGWLSCTPTPSTEFENFLNQSTEKNYTLLIQNGQIMDGLGNDEYSADLLIQDDTIAFIGQVDTALIQVKKTIDAAGKVVTPGFIDMHSHGNPLKTPEFKNFWRWVPLLSRWEKMALVPIMKT